MKTPNQWLEVINPVGAITQPAGTLRLLGSVQDDALKTALLSEGHEEACECLLCHKFKTIIAKRDAEMSAGKASCAPAADSAPPAYEIKTVQDFLLVPEDSIGACLDEFRDYLECARDITAIAKRSGEILGAKETKVSVGSFNWTDDGIREGTIRVETGVVMEARGCPSESDPVLRVEPQPNIKGSYVQDGDKWHYCEMDDMDRMCAKEHPLWKTIRNPFGAEGDLRKSGEGWVWVKTKT